MIFSTPKMSVSPAATRNSNMPMIRAPVACVTMQAEVERHVASVAKSMADRGTNDFRYCQAAAGKHRAGSRGWACAQALRIVLPLFPVGFELEDLFPIASRHVDDVWLAGNRRTPPDRVADQRLVLGS